MKKIGSIFALSALLFAGAAFADDDTNAVYSANAVGVIKYTIPPEGGLTCITLPLNPMGGAEWYWTDTSLATQLPKGSSVYLWDGTGWLNYSKNPMTGKWTDAVTNRPIRAGEAIFVKGPAKTTTPTVISLLGEVPDEDMSYELTGSNNLDTGCVSMFPVETVFAESDLATQLPKGSSVYFWDGSGWLNYSKNPMTGKWTDAVTNKVVAPGEGIFIKVRGDAMTIDYSCPYEL